MGNMTEEEQEHMAKSPEAMWGATTAVNAMLTNMHNVFGAEVALQGIAQYILSALPEEADKRSHWAATVEYLRDTYFQIAGLRDS